MSPLNAPAFCCSTVGTLAFQPKRPRLVPPVRGVGHPVGPTRHPVPVGVVRVGVGEHGCFLHRFEQADAEHGRGDARADLYVRWERADGRLEDLVGRRLEREGRPVGERARPLLVADLDLPLARHTVDRPVLQLGSVAGHRHRPPVGPGHAEPQEQPQLGVIGAGRRLRAAVLEVAGRAGLRVERGPETISAGRGGRRRHPVVVEEVVADGEGAAVLGREGAQSQAEGGGGLVEDRALAPGQRPVRVGDRVRCRLLRLRGSAGAVASTRARRHAAGRDHQGRGQPAAA